MAAFQPGGDIDEQSEAGGVALGEAIGAEAFDLFEAGFGKISFVAARGHAADHFCAEFMDGADVAKCRHCAAQGVGFLGREFRGLDGDPHRLFLE